MSVRVPLPLATAELRDTSWLAFGEFIESEESAEENRAKHVKGRASYGEAQFYQNLH